MWLNGKIVPESGFTYQGPHYRDRHGFGVLA